MRGRRERGFRFGVLSRLSPLPHTIDCPHREPGGTLRSSSRWPAGLPFFVVPTRRASVPEPLRAGVLDLCAEDLPEEVLLRLVVPPEDPRGRVLPDPAPHEG